MIIEYLKERITGGNRPKVSRTDVLTSRPMRNPQVAWARETVAGESRAVALLRIPRRSDRFGNIVAKIFHLPEFRKLELDEIGSDVWEMCDGATSVDSITRAIVTQYKMNRRQAETSVTAYLRMLAERRLLILKKGASASKAKSTSKGERRQKKA